MSVDISEFRPNRGKLIRVDEAEFVASGDIAGALTFAGYTCQETSGSAVAAITIHKGLTAAGPVIGYINLAAGESVPPVMLDEPIDTPGGIHVEVVSGAVALTVFYEA